MFLDLINPILLTSLLAAFCASISSGIIGSYVVVKRMVSIAGSIAHAILGGIGITLWIQYYYKFPEFYPIYGALISAILIALIIGWVHLRFKEREDALIAVIWSVGMSLGIIMISYIPSFNSELLNFLLGNILWIQASDLNLLVSLDIAIVCLTFIFHSRFLALCFDEQQLSLQGYNRTKYYFLLLILIATSIVILTYIIGIILVLSMLTIPCCIVGRFSHNLVHIMLGSILLNIILSFLGIFLAYFLDLPVGPTIALISGLIYCSTFCLKNTKIYLS